MKFRNILIFSLAIFLLQGCSNLVKVKVEYRKIPIMEGLDSFRVLLGQIENHCKDFDAAHDVSEMFMRKARSEKTFSEITNLPKEAMPFGKETNFEEFLKHVSTFDWRSWEPGKNADLFLFGSILFESTDTSGYDSEWYITRSGERVPAKVWKDRMMFKYCLHLVLVDLKNGKVVLDKQLDAKNSVEGAADEVAVFMDITDKKLDEFFNAVQGEKVKSYRYLMKR